MPGPPGAAPALQGMLPDGVVLDASPTRRRPPTRTPRAPTPYRTNDPRTGGPLEHEHPERAAEGRVLEAIPRTAPARATPGRPPASRCRPALPGTAPSRTAVSLPRRRVPGGAGDIGEQHLDVAVLEGRSIWVGRPSRGSNPLAATWAGGSPLNALFAKEHDPGGATGEGRAGTAGEKSGGTTASSTSAPPDRTGTTTGCTAALTRRAPVIPREVGVPYGHAGRPARRPRGGPGMHLRSSPPCPRRPYSPRQAYGAGGGRGIANLSLSRQAAPPGLGARWLLADGERPPRGPKLQTSIGFPEGSSGRYSFILLCNVYFGGSTPLPGPFAGSWRAPSGPPERHREGRPPGQPRGAQAPGSTPPGPTRAVRRPGPATSAGPHGRGRPGRPAARPPRSARTGS